MGRSDARIVSGRSPPPDPRTVSSAIRPAMRDRSALLWGRGATARRLLAVEEATIDLYRICALHGVAVGP